MKQEKTAPKERTNKNSEKPKRFNKSKLKWRLYTGEIRNRYVDPKEFKRLHAPLDNVLTFEPEFQGYCVTLRPCGEGVDKNGKVRAVAYSTHNGRFFDQDNHGLWNEHKISYTPNKPSLKNGRSHSDYPKIIIFGDLCCHLLIIHAWHGARPKGKVCDHLDTNLLNLNADNFEWVDKPENYRRQGIARRLRKAAIDPKRLTPTLMKGIYTLPEGRLEEFIGRFLFVSKDLEAPMDVMSIRLCVATALDWMKASAANINC